MEKKRTAKMPLIRGIKRPLIRGIKMPLIQGIWIFLLACGILTAAFQLAAAEPAYASDEISAVEIYMDEPQPGVGTNDFMNATVTAGSIPAEFEIVEGIWYYDYYGGFHINNDEPFRDDRVYTLMLRLRTTDKINPNTGKRYEFLKSDGVFPYIIMNSDSDQTHLMDTYVVDEHEIAFKWIFTKGERIIYDLYIDNVDPPIPGEPIGTSAITISSKPDEFTAYPLSLSTGGRIWQYKDNDVWHPCPDGAVFEEGIEYRLRLNPMLAKGYRFASAASATIDGTPGYELKQLDQQYCVYLEYPPLSEPYTLQNSDMFVVKAGVLNVRSSKSRYSSRLGNLKFGNAFEAKLRCGDWIGFDFEGQTGWVLRKYLAITYSADTMVEPRWCTVTANALNVREDISTSSTRIGGLKYDDRILVTGERYEYDDDQVILWSVLEYKGENPGDEPRLAYVQSKFTSYESAKVEKKLETIGFSYFPETVSTKSYAPPVAVSGEYIAVSDDLIAATKDGLLKIILFAEDAYAFSNLGPSDIQLPSGCDFKIISAVPAGDGSTLTINMEKIKPPVVAPKKPKVKKPTSFKVKAGKRKAIVTWKKVSGVTGYKIKYSKKKSFSKAKTKTVKGASHKKYTIKKLKKGKRVYVKMRAYKKYKGKTYYGPWTKAKSVKVK